MRPASRAEACDATRGNLQVSLLFASRLVRRVKGQIAIIDGLKRPPFILFDVTTRKNPFATQLSQTFTHVGAHRRIAVGTAGIVDAHGWILFQLVLEVARWVLADLAERNAHTGLCAVDVDAT